MNGSCKRTAHTVITRETVSKFVAGIALAGSISLTGCSSTSTFSAYPAKINPIINTIQTGQTIDFSQCLISECKSNDAILYEMERGRFALIQGKTDVSMKDFADAMERVKQNDEKAKISASDIGANIAATAVNDNAIPYEGEGYERVMLHHYQAINYLKKKDLDGAGVEVRRANAEQEDALKRHDDEVEKSREKAGEENTGSPQDNPAFTTAYAQMDEVAGKVKNSFQNAYTFYLSGFIYEALQQPNDAYIDYKKALEIYPDNASLQKDVVRLAGELKMSEDAAALKTRFNLADVAAIPAGNGDLLVLFEDGFVPQKQQIKIPLPVPNVGLMAAAFPIYREKTAPSNSLFIESNGGVIGSTEQICDFRALSVKALKEKVPVIATRQVARILVKGAATKAAKDHLGAFGELGMSIWNLVSENADLRSWVSLPADAQVLRVALPAGTYKMLLKQRGTLKTASVDVEIAGGSRTILHVIRAGLDFYPSVISLAPGKTSQIALGAKVQL